MLTNTEFVTQSITLNIFYLTNMRSFSLNINLAFLNQDYIKKSQEFLNETDNIINSFINNIDGLIPEFALLSNFIVTNFTLSCEKLTEKLFGVDLKTYITEKLLSLSYANAKVPTQQDIDLMTKINNQTLNLATKFIEFLKEIFSAEINNRLFSYTSPFFVRTLIDILEIHVVILKRTISKTPANPTSVVNYEYKVICFFKSCVTLLGSLVDPTRDDIYHKANSLNKEFEALKDKYKVVESNPEELHKITILAKKLINKFSNFISDLIIDLLYGKVYFIVEPSMLDDILRITNYVIYNINILQIKLK